VPAQQAIQEHPQTQAEPPRTQATPPQKETKDCPFCGEEILAVAKKCKHCGETVDVTLRAAEESSRGSKRPRRREDEDEEYQDYLDTVARSDREDGNTSVTTNTSTTVLVNLPPNFPHVLHIVLTFLTCGTWLPVYLLHAILASRGGGALLAFLLGVPLCLGFLSCGGALAVWLIGAALGPAPVVEQTAKGPENVQGRVLTEKGRESIDKGERAPEPEWADGRKGIRRGSVEVSVTYLERDASVLFSRTGSRMWVGKVPVPNGVWVVHISITHLGTGGPVNYQGWGNSRNGVLLTYCFENNSRQPQAVRQMDLGHGLYPTGQTNTAEVLQPGRSHTDILLFPAPPDAAQLAYADLILDGQTLGMPDRLVLRIPKSEFPPTIAAPVALDEDRKPPRASDETLASLRKMLVSRRMAWEQNIRQPGPNATIQAKAIDSDYMKQIEQIPEVPSLRALWQRRVPGASFDERMVDAIQTWLVREYRISAAEAANMPLYKVVNRLLKK
jgi:hypothetical protein